MEPLHARQCGLRTHFGEIHKLTPALMSTLSSKQASDSMLPSHARFA